MHATPLSSTFQRTSTATVVIVALALAAAALATVYLADRPGPYRPIVGSAEAAAPSPPVTHRPTTEAEAAGDPSVPRAADVFQRAPAGIEEPPATF